MRVMHVTFDMRIGGTEMVIKNIIEGNTDADIEMSIYCIEAPLGPWGEDLKASGTPIAVEERQPGFDKSLISKIRKHIKGNDIDILHCHQYTPWVYGALAAAFTKTKVVFTEHGRFYPDSSSWKRRLINPFLTCTTDKITTISYATKSALTEFEFIPMRKISVIYNGINELKLNKDNPAIAKESFQIPKDSFVLGTIARFDPIKNHLMMLEAFALARETNLKLFLIIVGDGDERQNIERKIDNLGIKEHVLLTGYQPNPSRILALFDIFLLSSLSEGTSMTLLESLSLRIPCVVTDAGGNSEIIIDEYNGLVTPNNDALAYAKAILKSSSIDLEELRTNARTSFEEHFTNTKMVKSYIAIYNELVRSKP